MRPPDRRFLGHPAGLGVLAFTEAWERFSFYGMQTLLPLYMADDLLKPDVAPHIPGLHALGAILGSGGAQAFASRIFGLYTAAVYVTPVLGSLIADRLTGRAAAILGGCACLAAGHLAMTSDALFLPALFLLVTGCGLMKGNIASQVGALYPAGDQRRTDAFQIFSTAIAAGVILAPLICGGLANARGYHWGFGAAAIGMGIAAATYVLGRGALPADTRATRLAKAALTRPEILRVIALLGLIPVLAVIFLGNNQVFNIYLLWARDHANLHVLGHPIPVEFLLSIDAACAAIIMPASVVFWRAMAARGIAPDELAKMAGASILATANSLYLSGLAAWSAHTHTQVPFLALVLFHILNNTAFAHLVPTGLALYSRHAPPTLNATMLGLFYTLFFGTNLLVGEVGAYYSRMSGAQFWLLQAGLVGAAAAALLLAERPLRRVLA